MRLIKGPREFRELPRRVRLSLWAEYIFGSDIKPKVAARKAIRMFEKEFGIRPNIVYWPNKSFSRMELWHKELQSEDTQKKRRRTKY